MSTMEKGKITYVIIHINTLLNGNLKTPHRDFSYIVNHKK